MAYKNVGVHQTVQDEVNKRRGEKTWTAFITEMVGVWDRVQSGDLITMDQAIEKLKVYQSFSVGEVALEKPVKLHFQSDKKNNIKPIPKVVKQDDKKVNDVPLKVAAKRSDLLMRALGDTEIDDVDVTERKEYSPECGICVHPDCLKFEAIWFKEQNIATVRKLVEESGKTVGEHMSGHRF